jgi:hypothetical protein
MALKVDLKGRMTALPGKKGKGTGAANKFKASAGAKYVLFIGDEGAILVYIDGNVVQNRQFVPDAGEANLAELRNSLAEDPKAPLLMVIDSMDQSYVQQTLPPVSQLSVKKLIKRRLDRDFANNDIKGAIVLGRELTGRKDWNFLMVAVEKSPQLVLWLDFVASAPNRFQGIYLVSVETENIVKALEAAMGVPKEGTGSEWKFFVSHNKVGGFRQVILRNGRIIFTRLAQPVGDSTPEVVAGSIEQEMLSTIEYMRRLSYNPQAGLDVYIVASSAIKSAIDKSKFNAKSTQIMTPYEVAQYLDIEGATQPTDQFGDVILAAFIGCNRKHVLTLTTPQSKQLDALYQVFIYQRVAAAMMALGIIGYAGTIGYDIVSAYSSGSELEEKKTGQERNLAALKEQIKGSSLDIEKTGDMIDLYKMLLQARLSPLPMIGRMEQVLKPPIVVRSIEWSLDEEKTTAAVAAPPPGMAIPGAPGVAAAPGAPLPKMTAVLTLEFPGITTSEAFKAVSQKILADMKSTLQGYDVAYTQVPTGFSENEKLEMTFDNGAAAAKGGGASGAQALQAKMTIKGSVVIATATP